MLPADDRPQFSEDEAKAEFAALFPNGWAGTDVLGELAPNGWANSPLVAVCHPSAEQVYEESVRMHRNMQSLPFARKPDAPPPPPEPTLDEIRAEHVVGEIEPERECQELLGRCLWDVFCDNHDVFDADGRVIDLGSMRAGGGFLAEVLNAQPGPKPLPRPDMDAMFEKMFQPPPEQQTPDMMKFMADMRKEMLGDGGYTYLDFYLGTMNVSGRADLGPVYEMIFRRLRGRGLDWKYTFPRLYAVDFRPLKKMLDDKKREEEGESEFEGYDPSAAFEADEEERRKDEELAELREKLDEGHREAVETAQEREPPATVLAYRAVYGEWPEGWPPEVGE